MLEGGVALVTGASRGIGRAVVERLHGEGMAVALLARKPEPLRVVADDLSRTGGGRVLAVACDVTEPESVRNAVTTVHDALGPIDLLVNNAGIAEADDRVPWEADPDDWWQVLTTNLRGPMLLCRAVVPGMVARGSGRVINVNSTRSVRAEATQTAYGVSKCAVGMLTRALAAGLAGTGVCVFDYSPGRVRTDLTASLYAHASPKGSWTPIERAVDGLVAVASGRYDALAGRFLHADDDLPALAARFDEVVRHDGRVIALSAAFDGDPLLRRIAGQRVTAPSSGC